MNEFVSYSSYGEDAMLLGLMARLQSMNDVDLLSKNSYIDVGCYHPIFDNNTAFLYKAGWRGTLVDPNPALKDEILKYRFLDLFLEVAVDSEPGVKEFMMFNDGNTSNGLDKEFTERIRVSSGNEIKKVVNVQCITLEQVFDKHIERFKSEPLVLNIDIEGMDYKVISSYSFKYRPLFILIEDDILGGFEGSKLKTFMESKNYRIVSSNFLTSIYMDSTSPLFASLKKLGYYDRIEQ